MRTIKLEAGKNAHCETCTCNNPTVDDIFAGMGGWSIGFHRAGFNCHGVDIVDIGYPYDLTLSDVKDYHPSQEYDVVVESPPCTEFSQLTILSYKKGQRGPPDPEKGLELVRQGKRIIDEAHPKFWLIENVWGSMKYLLPFLGMPKITAKPWVLWGNFPDPNLGRLPNVTQKSLGAHLGQKTTLGKGGNKIGLPEDFPFDPLRSWKRARIPVFLSERIAEACKQALSQGG
jgi:hypothetical protein